MVDKKEISLIQTIVELARDAQLKQTKEAIVMLAKLPKTPETKELLKRLRVADEKIKKQCDFVLKLDRLVRKYA
jgi:hypothetical protein